MRFVLDTNIVVSGLRSPAVAMAVAEKVSAMKTADFFAQRRADADIEASRRLLRRTGGSPPRPEDRMS
jgi:hypothetical protein